MFILVNIIVISIPFSHLSCLTFVLPLMTCILTNFLVVFNRDVVGGWYLYHGGLINLVLFCFKEEKM